MSEGNHHTEIVQEVPTNGHHSPMSLIRVELSQMNADYKRIVLDTFRKSYKDLGRHIETLMLQNLEQLENQVRVSGKAKLSEIERRIFSDLHTLWEEFAEQIEVISQYMKTGMVEYIRCVEKLTDEVPISYLQIHSTESLKIGPEDNWNIKREKYKQRTLTTFNSKPPTIKVHFRSLFMYRSWRMLLPNVHSLMKSLSIAGYHANREINHLLNLCRWELSQLEFDPSPGQQLSKCERNIQEYSQKFQDLMDQQNQHFHESLKDISDQFIALLESDVQKWDANSIIDESAFKPDVLKSELLRFPQSWNHNQLIFQQYGVAAIELMKVHNQFDRLSEKVQFEVRVAFFNGAASNLREIKENIAQLRKAIETKEIEKLERLLFPTEGFQVETDYQILGGLRNQSRIVLEGIPEGISLVRPLYLDQFLKGNREKVESFSCPLRNTVDYLIETHFYAPLSVLMTSIPQKFKKIYFQIQDGTRLIELSLSEIDPKKEETLDQLNEIVDKAEMQINAGETALKELQKEIEETIDESEKNTLEKLSPEVIAIQAEQLKRRLVGSERLRGINRFYTQLIEKTYLWRDEVRKIWGRTRDDIVIAEFERSRKPFINPYARLQSFVEQVSPSKEVLKALPFYYVQLFSGGQSAPQSQLPNRESELALALDASRRMKNGAGGGIIITGELFAGKTYLLEGIANQYFNGKIYRILPPLHGSIRVQDLHWVIQRQLQQKGSTISQLIEQTEPGSVFLLNDLELWWLRHPEGYEVIHEIIEIIHKFSKEYYFICSINDKAYKLLTETSILPTAFISTIQLRPFTSNQLRKTVITRHYSGGLSYQLEEEMEPRNKKRHVEDIFRKYLTLSRGNIGAAFRIWLSNIVKVERDMITIREPEDLTMPPVDNAEWLIILAQFVLHKHLTINQLVKVYREEQKMELTFLVEELQRVGLLVKLNKFTFGVNPYVYPYLMRQLHEVKIL